MTGQWIILRCSGANTLRLAQSLAWASIEAWSPVETQILRKGASRTRRQNRVPIMPTYVFAKAAHLHELLAIREAPTSPHPAFNFLRHVGEIRPIHDNALDALRIEEQKGRPPEKARTWNLGDQVRYPAAGFEGLVGTVERKKRKSVWVRFPNHPWPIETGAALLLPADPQNERRAA